MLLYYITDRLQFPGDETSRRHLLLKKIAEAARCRVDFIQLREKDLPVRDLESLAHEASQIIREYSPRDSQRSTRLLINSRSDIAVAVGADGVHLRADDISATDARAIWSCTESLAGVPQPHERPAIGVSCHSLADIARTEIEGADFAVFGPVFEKKNGGDIQPAGLDLLRQACQYKIPVLALGGITLESAPDCLDAGAAGIAAIRLFQENKIEEIVRTLRN